MKIGTYHEIVLAIENGIARKLSLDELRDIVYPLELCNSLVRVDNHLHSWLADAGGLCLHQIQETCQTIWHLIADEYGLSGSDEIELKLFEKEISEKFYEAVLLTEKEVIADFLLDSILLIDIHSQVAKFAQCASQEAVDILCDLSYRAMLHSLCNPSIALSTFRRLIDYPNHLDSPEAIQGLIINAYAHPHIESGEIDKILATKFRSKSSGVHYRLFVLYGLALNPNTTEAQLRRIFQDQRTWLSILKRPFIPDDMFAKIAEHVFLNWDSRMLVLQAQVKPSQLMGVIDLDPPFFSFPTGIRLLVKSPAFDGSVLSHLIAAVSQHPSVRRPDSFFSVLIEILQSNKVDPVLIENARGIWSLS